VPRAGIKPTPRTDIGYRPVTQTRQTRREPLGHHVPPLVLTPDLLVLFLVSLACFERGAIKSIYYYLLFFLSSTAIADLPNNILHIFGPLQGSSELLVQHYYRVV
jgi:hypothetical protein